MPPRGGWECSQRPWATRRRSGFSDEVGYPCVCCLLPLTSSPRMFLSHPQGSAASGITRGAPQLKPMTWVCSNSLVQSLFIQPQTRQDSNYRTQLGPQHGLCLRAPSSVKFLDASDLSSSATTLSQRLELGGQDLVVPGMRAGAGCVCPHNYPRIEMFGGNCNLRGRQRCLWPRIS